MPLTARFLYHLKGLGRARLCSGVQRVLLGNELENALLRAAFLVALALPACAHKGTPVTATTTAGQSLADEVAVLRKQAAERDSLVTQLEGRLSLLEAEQRQLRYALAERESTAALGVRETVRIGENEPPPERAREHAPKREARPVLRLYEDRPARSSEPLAPIPEVSERLPIAPLPDLSSTRVPAPIPEAVAPIPQDGYLAAIDMVRLRDFPAALASLDAFLAAHPQDERVAKALFWRGEVLFAQKQYQPALQAFQSSLQREPQGEKAADALLKISICHKRLGSPERARAAIHQLKTQFPHSHAARLAQAEEA